MELVKVLALQILAMFILSSVGFVLFKTGKVTKAGSKALGNLLVYVSLPVVIFRGFLAERTTEKMIGLGISAGMALLILIVGIIISHLLNRKDPIADFACCFSNPGFFGLPLIIASINEDAVFYVASFIGFLNVLQWTYGVFLLTKNKKDISLKRIVTTPTLIGLILGLIFFFSGGGNVMPAFIKTVLTHCANINTPIAMFTIGIYLAQTNLFSMVKRWANYKVSIIKLIIIPLVAFGLLCIIPNQYNALKLALLIAASCPTGSNIAVLAEMNNCDYPRSVETVVISTIFSLATMPLLVWLATSVWGTI